MWYLAAHGLTPYRVTAECQVMKEQCLPLRQRFLRRGCAAGRLLGLRIRIPAGAWMSVFCDCCVLSGREVSATG